MLRTVQQKKLLHFLKNGRVTIDLELSFYPFYFASAIAMWASVLAIILWFKNNFRKKQLMTLDPITSGALSFVAVLILMALNIPIGISMLIVGFTGFGFIVGFEQAFFILGTAPYRLFQSIVSLFYLSLF